MATKTAAIKSPKANTAQPAKATNAKTVQRKVSSATKLFSLPVQRKERSDWLYHQPLKAENSRPIIQSKIKIHSANDGFEKEADAVADKVVNDQRISSSFQISNTGIRTQRKCTSCENEEKEVYAKHIQRKCASCEKEEEVQKKTNDLNSFHSEKLHSSDSSPPMGSEHNNTNKLDSVLSSQDTRGSPLPDDTLSFMNHRLGADFSKVRIHTNDDSHEANASIGARAFTNGNNIHFAKGEFDPDSQKGRHLLAHELTHSIQQGAVQRKETTDERSPVKGVRKIVPKSKHEKKIARVPTPYHNKEDSQKTADEKFSKGFKNKKAPRLSSAALKKGQHKKLNKDPPVLPQKEKKKEDKPAKAPAKPIHLLYAKTQQEQISQLASKGIIFKPHDDKTIEENPVQKAQSLQSKRLSDAVLIKAAQSAIAIQSAIAQVRPRLMMASANAIARIKANEAAQKEKLNTEIKLEKDAVKKAMRQAAGSISGYHSKVISEIKTASTKAKADILEAKTINTTAIEAATKAQLPKIDKAYEDAKKDFEASGNSVGNECSSRQSQRSWNEFISKMKHEDDSLLDGPYTDDMKQARGDAAIKVGDGYKDGMIKAGKDQAGKIDAGKPNDYKKVDSSKAEMLKGVNELYDNSLKGIEAAEKAGISQADSTKKSMLASVYSQHKTAQSQLDTTEKMQSQFIEIISLKQSQQIELQASQATEAMEEGGSQSLMHLHNGFKEYKQVCESMNSPPPAMLREKLQPIEDNLARAAPSMIASLRNGMMQSEAGFNKTAAETITTTNTTVAQSLADSKVTNDKAIDGLKKLQSAAITSLHGILNNNKKTITATASQCVTGIQNIKTAFDGSLSQIATDLTNGLKQSSEEFKKGLLDAVNNGTAENKSMLATSMEEEQKAADQIQPRWKSVLKILLVIVVTLVIALVVGPAVIGFIGALAGGGVFGAAVGAVVGGAILGALSSGVITVGNNLIDGKSWHEGLGHAMLEGAITGAIGGAFGAAGSGVAGKLIGTAAKGIGPALGRFAIQQTFDFAGNIAVELASSKLQGKPFSWTNVAQGQAIGASMHIGIGGLDALKNVKGFKTVHGIMEGSASLGGKLGGAVRTKFTGVPVVESPATPVKVGREESHGTPGAPKEELPVTKPAEENISTAKPKEEPVSTTPEEETPAAPKEETPAAKPKEEPTQQKAPVEEKKPTNLTQEEKESGIAAKHPTQDGHNMKVTEGGMLVKCSTCEMVDFHSNPYKEELTKTKQREFAEEWDSIKKETNPEIKAKRAAEFDAKLNAEFDKQLSEGTKAAKKLGLPAAEEGYHWRDNGEGDPIYTKNSSNETGKQRVYDKEKGIFVDAETKPAPKPDIEAKYKEDATGKPVKESFDTQKATTKEAEQVKQAHEERSTAKQEKEKLVKGSDEYYEKNKEMIDKSEKMGEAAADAYMKDKYGLDPAYTGSGSRTVDKVYIGKDGKVYVVEAKGGSSTLGTKVSTEGSTSGKILEQGSKEYLEQTVKEMKASGDPKKIEAANKIEEAMKGGDLVYLHISQKVGPGGELVPATVKEFNID